MKYLLDSHTWIWWNVNPRNLSAKVKKLISDQKKYDELLLSAISPWEFCKLIEKGRLAISCDPLEWIYDALDIPKLRLVHLSPEISYISTSLPGSFHGDPADQIIVATARKEKAVILTKDKKISDYQLVKTLW